MSQPAEDDTNALGDTQRARPGSSVSGSGPLAVGMAQGRFPARALPSSVTAHATDASRHAAFQGVAEDAKLGQLAIPLAVAMVVLVLLLGPLSVFSAASTLGLSLYAGSVPRHAAARAYHILAVGYALCAVFMRLDVFPFSPFWPVSLVESWQWWTGVVVIELLFLGAYSAGSALRTRHVRVVQEFERAVRKASQREALLLEARDALRQGAGLGGAGRFTDQEIEGFRLGVVIGRGGMGEVYAAERLSDGEPAALKLLRVDLWGEKQALVRFARESKIVASIDSPHVVRVLEVSGPDAVCPFIAMELLAGVDLGTQLRERGRMSLEDVVDMVEQIAVGLEVAHAANVVHRDLKPQNVFRAGGAHGIVTWKVLDFGVSKLLDAGEASLTAAEIIGTPQYMAPEQAKGARDVDGRADIYALSAIAYRAITGEAPFRGDLHSVLRAILEEMPEAPSTRASLPDDIDLVLALGLAKRADDRFQSTREFAQAFEQAARGVLSADVRARAQALLASQPYKGSR